MIITVIGCSGDAKNCFIGKRNNNEENHVGTGTINICFQNSYQIL